jgi:type VI secretion system secreted protein Hcp
MPMPCHLTLKGEKQGAIEGSCEMQGREGTILVYELRHNVYMPRDPHSGLPTGKRVHEPFTIVKMIDKSSPKLFQALCTGEHMKNVTLMYYRISKHGTEEHYYTTILEDAIVTNFQPAMPTTLMSTNDPYGHMEVVSFTYKKIKHTWEQSGIEAEDCWTAPKQ